MALRGRRGPPSQSDGLGGPSYKFPQFPTGCSISPEAWKGRTRGPTYGNARARRECWLKCWRLLVCIWAGQPWDEFSRRSLSRHHKQRSKPNPRDA